MFSYVFERGRIQNDLFFATQCLQQDRRSRMMRGARHTANVVSIWIKWKQWYGDYIFPFISKVPQLESSKCLFEFYFHPDLSYPEKKIDQSVRRNTFHMHHYCQFDDWHFQNVFHSWRAFLGEAKTVFLGNRQKSFSLLLDDFEIMLQHHTSVNHFNNNFSNNLFLTNYRPIRPHKQSPWHSFERFRASRGDGLHVMQ